MEKRHFKCRGVSCEARSQSYHIEVRTEIIFLAVPHIPSSDLALRDIPLCLVYGSVTMEGSRRVWSAGGSWITVSLHSRVLKSCMQTVADICYRLAQVREREKELTLIWESVDQVLDLVLMFWVILPLSEYAEDHFGIGFRNLTLCFKFSRRWTDQTYIHYKVLCKLEWFYSHSVVITKSHCLHLLLQY